jgi:hypothetical protein
MTKIGFKLTISPFDYQIFTAPLTEPLRVDLTKCSIMEMISAEPQ